MQSLQRFFPHVCFGKIPHFSSIIRWSQRFGLGLLEQVKKTSEPYACILDHTIQIGAKKALAVVRVPMRRFAEDGALTLKDLEVVLISVKEKWSGEIVAKELSRLFRKIGNPVQFVMDSGSDILSGVKSFMQENPGIHLTPDISHFVANILKSIWGKDETFTTFVAKMTLARQQLQLTSLSFLSPPSLRSKGRFMQIGAVFSWAMKVYAFLEKKMSCPQNDEEIDVLFEKLGWIVDYRDFIQNAARDLACVNRLFELIKKHGLSQANFAEAVAIAKNITHPTLNTKLSQYLEREVFFAKRMRQSILVTSDALESGFGKYKSVAHLNSTSEMGSMLLTLPTICAQLDEKTIARAFNKTKTKNLSQWKNKFIGQSQLSKKRALMPKKIKIDSDCTVKNRQKVVGF